MCWINPCKNGGSCIRVNDTHYKCQCRTNFIGLLCESKYQNSTIFSNSVLLNQENSLNLLKLLNVSSLNVQMIYQASSEIEINSLIEKCKNITSLLVVIKLKNSTIIGQYYQFDISKESVRFHMSSFFFILDSNLKYPLQYRNHIKFWLNTYYGSESFNIEGIEAYSIDNSKNI